MAAEAVDHLSKTVRNHETGRVDPTALERAQHQAHGTAWLVSHVAGLTALHDWALRLEETDAMGPVEAGILRIGFAEYLNRVIHGLPMGQTETVRPHELGTSLRAMGMATDPTLNALFADPDLPEIRMATALAMSEHGFSDPADDPDGEISMMRAQYQRFAEAEIAPFCHRWHLDDVLIPDETVQKVADMGTFAITIPQAYDGLGLSKQAMVAVTEELSSFHLPTGSLATRPEIAGELISNSGTQDQKDRFLPGIASGKIMTTAVFTEPDIGSDLAHLSTRAVRRGAVYQVSGAKTWITHGGRSDLMTLLVRTQAGSQDHSGVSMLLAEKPRGTTSAPFPAPGMSGGEIRTLGYRGMKEYELSFDGFEVPAENLLGGDEGQGFKQLMATFESARIQTAARAVGVAQNALEIGMRYAKDRIQFSKPLYAFPRVYGKVAWMVVETMITRQLTYFSAFEKDQDIRCDIEAGMAKLLGARVAWSNADNALQIHGGNGYALEYQISRVLCDARILNIFEGAAEIQAQVVTRGILGR